MNERFADLRYAYARACMEELVKNPDTFWKVFERIKGKGKYLEPLAEDEQYSGKRRKNLEIFVKEMAYDYFVLNATGQVPIAIIDALPPDKKQEVLDDILGQFKLNLKSDCSPVHKEDIISGLSSTLQQLARLGQLEKDMNNYNMFMIAEGLKGIQIPKNTSGKDLITLLQNEVLPNCSYMQLEALYAFFINRLEKVEEELEIGLFVIAATSSDDKLDESVLSLDDETLKNKWQSYFLFRTLLKEKLPQIHEECPVVDTVGNLITYEQAAIYDIVLRRYEELFKSLLGGDLQNLKTEWNLFDSISGLNQVNNYVIKDNAILELIIQSRNKNINWGYIPEATPIPGMILLGFDIEGLSMPLRLHCSEELLSQFVQDYCRSDEEKEIPVFVGAEDFQIGDSYIGTPLILPLARQEVAEVKRVGKTIDKKKVSVAKHLACTNLPNPVSKLLTWKTDKRKKCPDYYNVITKQIRKTEVAPPKPGKTSR